MKKKMKNEFEEMEKWGKKKNENKKEGKKD